MIFLFSWFFILAVVFSRQSSSQNACRFSFNPLNIVKHSVLQIPWSSFLTTTQGQGIAWSAKTMDHRRQRRKQEILKHSDEPRIKTPTSSLFISCKNWTKHLFGSFFIAWRCWLDTQISFIPFIVILILIFICIHPVTRMVLRSFTMNSSSTW